MYKEIIENLFVNQIIESIGPNEKREKVLNNTFLLIKSILNKELTNQKEFSIKIIPFGSYPNKIYLSDSDLDITLFFIDKNESIYEYTYEFLSGIISKIDLILRKYKEISDIHIIHADIKLIKFKINSISVDISINNMTGLSKLFFFEFLESEILISKEKINLFKKTLILIKAWCSFEGSVLGSNIGLMGSYALECLVLLMFNLKNKEISNEISGFCLFFSMYHDLDWENNVMTIFGIVSVDEYMKLITTSDEDMFYSELSKIQKQGDLFNLIKYEVFEKFYIKVNMLNKQNKPCMSIISNRKVNIIKYVNIIDPLFPMNNLGKSINIFNQSKISCLFSTTHSILMKLHSSQIDRCLPIDYLNFLFKLFKNTMSSIENELLYLKLLHPKIVLNNESPVFDSVLNSLSQYGKVVSIDEFTVTNFNSLFLSSSQQTKIEISNQNHCLQRIFITKSIVDNIINSRMNDSPICSIEDLSLVMPSDMEKFRDMMHL